MITQLAHQLVSIPFVYDLLQRAAGFYDIARLLKPHLAATAGSSLLDLGAGTGNFRALTPSDTRYLWFDSDPVKLSGFRSKFNNDLAILGSGAELCFRDQSIDIGLFVSVSHHLTDEEFDAVLHSLSKMLRSHLIFFDFYLSPDRWISSLLARMDRGRYPRSREAILAMLAKHFDIEKTEDLSVYHRYVMAIATPKSVPSQNANDRTASMTLA
jgi:SAM-dependent methyltransferase